MNIIFDLDGTLIDSKLRLYRLFQSLAHSSSFSFDEYWAFKQSKISNETLLSSKLGYNQSQIAEFQCQWMALIESPLYLSLDRSFEGIETVLAGLRQISTLYVCTARQFRQPALDQLEKFSLLKYFKQVLVTQQKFSKESLIEANVIGLSSQDWIVGDTGKDVQVGKFLNIKTCAVLSGFLGQKELMSYGPDLIIESTLDLPLSDAL
ncbi:HAD hydrolase/ IA/ variant 1 family protein [Synechococcus sp. SYN20]|uniref:HAD family hydrolase n=1 Tax=Synechococcus sp. SYN20 TaxID=1050714 RepID=UPI00164820B1|nr:HAD hydrolase-like protein [Synechococcus sp. SYN20]QNJ24600.1 HAD hydrolase/ IA/ variant 1 family protein [Synechococcus sp. SYN20]